MRRVIVMGLGPACLLALGVAGACASSTFVCMDDADCEGLVGGACEADGYCSVPDPECPSQRRYAAHSGSLSNECVELDVADGGATEASSGAGSSDASGGATTLVMTTMGSGVDTGSTGGSELEPVLHLPLDDDFAAIGGAVDLGPFAVETTCNPSSCPASVAGVVGSAASFEGAQRLEVAGVGPLDLEDGLTIAVWVRDLAPDPLATRVIFSRLLGDGFAASYELEFFDSTITAGVAGPDGQALASVPYEPDPATPWMHLAIVVDGASLLLYRDAQLVATAEGAFVGYQAAPLFVGADQDGGGDVNDYFIGELDELKVFARPLSPTELATLASGMP